MFAVIKHEEGYKKGVGLLFTNDGFIECMFRITYPIEYEVYHMHKVQITSDVVDIMKQFIIKHQLQIPSVQETEKIINIFKNVAEIFGEEELKWIISGKNITEEIYINQIQIPKYIAVKKHIKNKEYLYGLVNTKDISNITCRFYINNYEYLYLTSNYHQFDNTRIAVVNHIVENKSSYEKDHSNLLETFQFDNTKAAIMCFMTIYKLELINNEEDYSNLLKTLQYMRRLDPNIPNIVDILQYSSD